MFQSSGVLVKSPDVVVWSGTTKDDWGRALPFWWASYAAIYRSQLWVKTVVDKRAKATARLPLKVYERADRGRPEATGHPYAELLRRPSKRYDPFDFWKRTSTVLDTYGEAFLGKVRDGGGRPVELVPMHPSYLFDDDTGGETWRYDNGRMRIENIARRDLVHFREFDPAGGCRGLSNLEPLRSTLENEDAARRANSAMWRNGARPGVVLKHPKTLSDAAHKRLGAEWRELHGGVDNWAKAALLEEGTDVTVLPLNVEELQYIEARRLNREEVCAVYDVPPPVVHILDRATFSNITEQMRSMYRDTMAPHLKLIESTLEFELRDGRFGLDVEPDFGDGVYAEFLMDEVLRGDFEVRATAYQAAINAGWMMPSEVREKENLPYVEGSDRLLVNSTLVPIDTAAAPAEPLPAEAMRSLMGRLSRPKSLDEIDPDALVAGLNGSTPLVLHTLELAKAAGDTVAQLRARLSALAAKE